MQQGMNLEVFRAASTGDLSFFKKLIDPNGNLIDPNGSTLLQVTIEKNTVLHVALQFKRFDFAERTVNLSPSLVYETNSKGNTVLHVAARWVESSSIVKLIIQKAKEERDPEVGGQQLLRMVNQDGDTALHVAVRYKNFDVVKDLIEEDREELAKYVNKARESALFLAVDREFYDIASLILRVASKCSYVGRHGMNVLHALVIRTSSFTLRELRNYGQASAYHRLMVSCIWVLKIILSTYPLMKSLSREAQRFSCRNVLVPDQEDCPQSELVEAVLKKWQSANKQGDDLGWQFIIEQSDDSGWTPLHLAAHLGNYKIIKLLLKKKESLAYAKNKEGLSALHIAAMEGNLSVMKELITACPDIYEMLDNRGQTAFHAAAESGQFYLLVFTLFKGLRRFDGLESLVTLISEQNEEGNTPLYLAVIKGYFMSLKLLDPSKGIDLNATNKEGFTTMDKLLLGRASFELEFWKKLQIKPLWEKGARPSLRGAMALRNLDPRSRRKPEQAGDGDGNSDGDGDEDGDGNGKGRSASDFVKRVSETNLLVATLIATVTFTAAFTVPGGYNQNGNVGEGLAVLRKNTAFCVFLMANTLAFGLSTTSVFVHFLGSAAMVGNGFLREVVRHSISLTNWSVGALLVAFISGTYAVVPHSWGNTVAITLCCCFLISLFFPVFIKNNN